VAIVAKNFLFILWLNTLEIPGSQKKIGTFGWIGIIFGGFVILGFLWWPFIIFLFIILAFAIPHFLKKIKIKKLKSGEIPSREVIWKVSNIQYETWWKNNNYISSWFFMVEAMDSVKNEKLFFRSESFPYKEWWFKIEFWGLGEEDKKKFWEYVGTIVKIWDSAKVCVSVDNPKIYYIKNLSRSNQNNLEQKTDISIIGQKNIDNIFGVWENIENNAWYYAKKIAWILFVIFFVPIFLVIVSFVFFEFKSLDNLNLKLNSAVNTFFKGAWLWNWVWIIIGLLIIFILYKSFKSYKSK